MKKIIFSTCLAISAFCLSGCSDFLERDNYGRDTSWKTEDDVNKAVYALYHFVSPYWSEEICGRGHMWFECTSDNILIGRDRPTVDEIREFRMSPSNSNDVSRVWEVMYQNVAKANNIIKLVPDMKLSQGFKDNAVGTAYFFRGFSMLWMVPYYGDDTNGGIPIILDTTPAAEMDSPRPAHVTMNYDQIISDMRTAGNKLPLLSELSASQYGLPHKAAAWAFGARAALYAAQYDAKYYDIVLEFCNYIDALTGADKRELYVNSANKLSSYANLWTKAQNHSKEYIFSLEGDATNGARYHGVSFVNAGWGYYNTWGYYTPSKELWDAYESGDQRRDATILYPGQQITFMGRNITFGGYCTDNSISSHKTSHISAGLVLRKFMSPWETGSYSEVAQQRDKLWNTLNVCLMRYADVMLMKAEALIWKNGEGDATAKQLLNQIRDRAGLPQDSQATKAQLKNERRCELAFEFQPSRHVDVVRWGDAKEVYAKPANSVISKMVNGEIVTETAKVYDGRTYDPTYHKVFPIPQSAFAGTVHLKQNKGY
ncbi:RagB/SusD family nutrient uptake outer membrane protein [uncultured Alistipes sp.]|jgi:putative lipoprotein|uniref:RagB/SusD family nutrient uptake outer membrane protein n=1 Tax=uncultured Alistipes sp. TaxID=538949 RepID=UPI0025CBD506|nr:RagB/SusD family nutrient uptake outer membrane protein [uncultured Alistipes sp.]